jgi:hypothetical protein
MPCRVQNANPDRSAPSGRPRAQGLPSEIERSGIGGVTTGLTTTSIGVRSQPLVRGKVQNLRGIDRRRATRARPGVNDTITHNLSGCRKKPTAESVGSAAYSNLTCFDQQVSASCYLSEVIATFPLPRAKQPSLVRQIGRKFPERTKSPNLDNFHARARCGRRAPGKEQRAASPKSRSFRCRIHMSSAA